MLEKLTAIKEDFFSLKSKIKILVLIGILIILLGGMMVGTSYFLKSNKEGTRGTAETGRTEGTTTLNTLQRPDWAPQTRDICGDGICGITEEAGQNMCSKDCSNRPLAIDNFIATPAVVTPGQTAVLSWSSTASFCASSGSEDSWFVTGGAASGSVHTTPLQLSKTYTLSCMNDAGELQTKEVTVMVKSPTVKPSPILKKILPTITFTAAPSNVSVGQGTTLFWIATNATSCSASGDGASWGWNGTRPTRGTQITPPITSSQTYTIKCTGKNGSLSKTVSVSSATAPSVSLSALPNIVSYGEKATLAWIISDAESCTTSNSGGYPEWSGVLPSGSLSGGKKTTPPLTGDQTFTMTCVSGTGTATATTTEEVTVVVSEASSCTLPSGEEVSSGSSVEEFQAGTVAYGGTCVSEKRNCLNGKLSGSYTNQSCKVTKGKDCSLGGTTIKSGETITAYKDAINALGSGKLCAPETRHCEDGTLSGSYVNPGCVSFPVTGKESETTCGTWDGVTPVATFQGLENCNVNSCKWYGYVQSGDLYKCRAILNTTTNTWACKSLEKVNTGGRGCF